MSVVIVTGSCGLIGSETVGFFAEKGFDIVGIDNNMRQSFFGADGSILWNKKRLLAGSRGRPSHLTSGSQWPAIRRSASTIRTILQPCRKRERN